MPHKVSLERRRVAVLCASLSGLSATVPILLKGHPHVLAGVVIVIAIGLAFLVVKVKQLTQADCKEKDRDLLG